MAFEITLPRLGWDMEEGVLSSWLKKEDDYVNAGDLLFAVEGDKAIQEIEALDSGYLKFIPGGPQLGDKLPVGTLIGYLVDESELESFEIRSGIKTKSTEPQEQGPSVASAPMDGFGERIGPSYTGKRIYISPYAKRMAEGLGINWAEVAGSGFRGRIMAKDIQAAAEQRDLNRSNALPVMTPSSPEKLTTTAVQAEESTRLPMTHIRRKIAEHMAFSAHTAAPVTLTSEVDATEFVTLRKVLKADTLTSSLPTPSYNDLLAKASAQALTEHPFVNARLEGDDIVQSSAVNIGIAVDTDRGLVVPVLRDVHKKSLRQVTRESAALIENTRNGSISYDNLQGATFTITNLGIFEIDAFTPIIDLPQCAILGVGRIHPKQVVVDAEQGKVEIRHMMFLSLTFDHRLIDGAQAARFLQRIKRFIEKPYLWMAGN
jgi:pyruvate dehydrogenase E2 component (dihydrolipoamide acetyltransferase)